MKYEHLLKGLKVRKMIKLSISNLAWDENWDNRMYFYINKLGFQGIEIAPSRIFGIDPYRHLTEAANWALSLKEKFDLSVSSMQSIWYGQSGNIFESVEEREVLFQYSLRAIEFATAISCKNLVFGCPKNRNMKKVCYNYEKTGFEFFKKLGYIANQFGTKIAIEPNPAIYNTNYLNTTDSVKVLLEKTGQVGLGLNFDFGAFLYNNEKMDKIQDYIPYINHIHISEPGLSIIKRRAEHEQLFRILNENKYNRFVSIEMRQGAAIREILEVMEYVKGVCDSAKS